MNTQTTPAVPQAVNAQTISAQTISAQTLDTFHTRQMGLRERFELAKRAALSRDLAQEHLTRHLADLAEAAQPLRLHLSLSAHSASTCDLELGVPDVSWTLADIEQRAFELAAAQLLPLTLGAATRERMAERGDQMLWTPSTQSAGAEWSLPLLEAEGSPALLVLEMRGECDFGGHSVEAPVRVCLH